MSKPRPMTFADALMNFLARRDDYLQAIKDRHSDKNEINILLMNMLKASEEINDTLTRALFQVVDNGR